jgi:hypothetical protein
MTFSEVKKMCEDIQYYAGPKLKPDDEYEFKKLYQRVKDDEDLDSMSSKKLQAIYDKYLKK